MKQKPILFSTPMVHAILAKRKTETRRLKGLENINAIGDYELHGSNSGETGMVYNIPNVKAPYQPGDVLWVRETWRKYHPVDADGYTNFDELVVEFAADSPEEVYMKDGDGFQVYNHDGSERCIPWKPSIHMPKAAARIWLKVLDVYPERVQDITEESAKNEGAEMMALDDIGNTFKTYRRGFESLWSSINGEESWKRNDWVWVIKFEQIQKP